MTLKQLKSFIEAIKNKRINIIEKKKLPKKTNTFYKNSIKQSTLPFYELEQKVSSLS